MNSLTEHVKSQVVVCWDDITVTDSVKHCQAVVGDYPLEDVSLSDYQTPGLQVFCKTKPSGQGVVSVHTQLWG